MLGGHLGSQGRFCYGSDKQICMLKSSWPCQAQLKPTAKTLWWKEPGTFQVMTRNALEVGQKRKTEMAVEIWNDQYSVNIDES